VRGNRPPAPPLQRFGGFNDRNISHSHWKSVNRYAKVYKKPIGGATTPHSNGRVERSHRVDSQELYQLLLKDGIADDIHLCNDELRECHYCNYHRPHGTLDGQTPCERFLAKTAPVRHLRLESLHLEMAAPSRSSNRLPLIRSHAFSQA
jgi:hypothetical protein